MNGLKPKRQNTNIRCSHISFAVVNQYRIQMLFHVNSIMYKSIVDAGNNNGFLNLYIDAI